MKNTWKDRVKRAIKVAQPYLIGAGVALVAVGAGYLAVKHGKKVKTGTLVKLVGDAAESYFDDNQTSMTPDLIDIKAKLLQNPGTVFLNKDEDKRYSLLGGELTEFDNDPAHSTATEINKQYIDSLRDVSNLPVRVYLTQVAEKLTLSDKAKAKAKSL